MFKRLHISCSAISVTLESGIQTKQNIPDDLTSNEWNYIEEFITVLQPLKDATKFISQEKNPIFGFMMPIMFQIIHHHLVIKNTDSILMKELKKIIVDDLRQRWSIITLNTPDVIILSIYLDPWMKDFSFIKDDILRNQLLQKAFNIAQNLISSENFPTSYQSNNQIISHQRNKIANLFGKIADSTLYTNPNESELQQYHKKSSCNFYEENSENTGSSITNPLNWWNKHEKKYPQIAKLARKYLSVIGTSVSCERIFQKSGWIVNKKKIMFIRYKYFQFDFYFM